jgi:hypothetical protein
MSTGIAPTVSSASTTVTPTGQPAKEFAPTAGDGLRRLKEAIELAADVSGLAEDSTEIVRQFLAEGA